MKDQLLLIYSYLHGIWQYRWSALLVAWIIALPGWVSVYALPDKYSSQAIMHIDTKSVMRPLLKGLAVESKVDSGLEIMTQFLLSRKNLEEVIRDTDLNLRADNPAAMTRVVKGLAKSIVLIEERRSNIYHLSYEGASPDIAYQVVSKLLNTVIETTIDTARTDTTSAQKFLDHQITEYEKRLTEDEQRLAEFKRVNIGLMPDKTGGYYNRLQREQGNLDRLRSDLLLSKRKLSEMRKQLEGEAPLLGGDYSGPKVAKLRRYRERLEILLTQFTEQHPDVMALRNTIADTLANKDSGEDDFIDITEGSLSDFNPVYQELKVEIHRISVEVETLKLKLVEKERIVIKLKQSVDIIPDVEAKLSKLNRDYEITRKRHLSMIERRESARLAQEVGQSGSNIKFRIIEPPRVPTKPSAPNRVLLLSAVFFVALAAGLGWGALKYLVHPTFIASSQIRDVIDIPMLGSVGLFLTAEHKRRRRLQLTFFLLVFSLLVAFYSGSIMYTDLNSYLVNTLLLQRGATL